MVLVRDLLESVDPRIYQELNYDERPFDILRFYLVLPCRNPSFQDTSPIDLLPVLGKAWNYLIVEHCPFINSALFSIVRQEWTHNSELLASITNRHDWFFVSCIRASAKFINPSSTSVSSSIDVSGFSLDHISFTLFATFDKHHLEFYWNSARHSQKMPSQHPVSNRRRVDRCSMRHPEQQVSKQLDFACPSQIHTLHGGMPQ